MKKAELVFIPSPGISHLVPIVEFAKRLLDRDDRFSITVLLIMKSVSGCSASTETIEASDTRIRFIKLPHVDPPLPDNPKVSKEKLVTDHRDSYKPYVKEAIIRNVLSNGDSVTLAGLLFDMFCSSMVDVGKELGVPSYLFFPSNAAFLALMLHLPDRHEQVGKEFEEFDSNNSIIPGYVNPVPSSVLPLFLFNKHGGYDSFVNHGRRFKETNGMIVNTCGELESHAVKSLLNNDHIPPVYIVGPLIDLKGQDQLQDNGTERDEILQWLDEQLDLSVVFLCFGSQGSFDEDQVKEIALGLEQSGHRFLWSLRKPPPKGKLALPSDYMNPQEVLPNGFLERTKEKGLVCGWAPQKEVLAHRSIGAFVSHCGWNSVLESLWYGVPILTWPMYAEQQINAFQMVKDLGLAVELKLDYRNTSGEVVLGDKIATAIRRVMEDENDVRKRVREQSENSRLAVVDGGPSFAEYGRLIQDLLGNMTCGSTPNP